VRPKSGLSDKDTGKLLRVKERVVAAVLDPGAVVDAHDVGVRDAGERKAGEGQEPEIDKKRPLKLGNVINLEKFTLVGVGHEYMGCFVIGDTPNTRISSYSI